MVQATVKTYPEQYSCRKLLSADVHVFCKIHYVFVKTYDDSKRKHLLTEVKSSDAHRSAVRVMQYSVCKYSIQSNPL